MCTRVRVCAGGRRGRAPRSAGHRRRLCPPQRRAAGRAARPDGPSPAAELRPLAGSAGARCPGSPPHPPAGARPLQPRGSPRSSAGAAGRRLGSTNLCAPQPHGEVAVRPGRGRIFFASSPAAEQKQRCVCRSPAPHRRTTGLFPARKVVLVFFCPRPVIYLPLCSPSRLQCSAEERGKLLEGGRRGLVTIPSALPPPPAFSRVHCPSQGHGCSASGESRCAPVAGGGGRLSPAGSQDLPFGLGPGAE